MVIEPMSMVPVHHSMPPDCGNKQCGDHTYRETVRVNNGGSCMVLVDHIRATMVRMNNRQVSMVLVDHVERL